MTCGQYDDIYSDVACGAPVEPSARDRALEHAEGCARCRARLETERALSGGLAALAAADDAAEAPPRVKAAALAAVRARAVASAAPPPALSWRRPALALAAALAALAAIVGLWPAAQPAPAPSGVAGGSTPALPGPGLVTPPVAPPVEISKGPGGTPVVRPRHRKTQRTTDNGQRTTTEETVTDYIPLTYLDGATAMESGHVVRVEVPRAALASFGLSDDASERGETVKADVIIGDDGVARAIRFVR